MSTCNRIGRDSTFRYIYNVRNGTITHVHEDCCLTVPGFRYTSGFDCIAIAVRKKNYNTTVALWSLISGKSYSRNTSIATKLEDVNSFENVILS